MLGDADRPDDLRESLLNGQSLVDGSQEEGAGEFGIAQPPGEIDVPVFATSCHAGPPDSPSRTAVPDGCSGIGRPWSPEEQEKDLSLMLPEVEPVPGTDGEPGLPDPAADGLVIAEVPRLEPRDPGGDAHPARGDPG
jgi:hypothetical protein